MPEAVQTFERVFIDDPARLSEFLPRLESEAAIGIDIEMGQRVKRLPGGLQEWSHILALVQIAAGNLSLVIDPLRVPVEPLKSLMRSGARKIFLGGGQDDALLGDAGVPVRNVVDVGEVALALFGRRQDGMAALSDRIFGISLDKTIRRADWLKRPLDPVLLAYAHRDAELTLQIYYWFDRNYPDVLRLHERLILEPSLPSSAPEWLVESLANRADPMAVVMDLGFDVERDAEMLSDEARPFLQRAASPRLLNRLVRVAGDLRLRPLLPDILPLVDSRSSLLRASAARAVGQLSGVEAGTPILEGLMMDDIDDVAKAAQTALKELRTQSVESPAEVEEESAGSSLDEDSVSALAALKARLESG